MPKTCPVCGSILVEEEGFLCCRNCAFKVRLFPNCEIKRERKDVQQFLFLKGRRVMRTMKGELEKNEKKVDEIVNNPLNLRIPTLKMVEKTAEQEEIDKVVASARKYIAEIPGHVFGLVSRMHAIESASVEERAIRAKERKDLEEEIATHLNNTSGIAGEAARHAYVVAMIATMPPEKNAILSAINGKCLLPGLLQLGVLSNVDGKKAATTVKVFGKAYAVHGNKATEIADKLKKLINEAYGAEIRKIKDCANISIAELLDGKGGRAFVDVPDDKDNDRFFPGGIVLAGSDGKVVRPIEFLGHFQAVMAEIYKAGIFIPVRQLHSERLSLPDMPSGTFRLCWIFHAILRRGIAAEMQKKNAQQKFGELAPV